LAVLLVIVAAAALGRFLFRAAPIGGFDGALCRFLIALGGVALVVLLLGSISLRFTQLAFFAAAASGAGSAAG